MDAALSCFVQLFTNLGHDTFDTVIFYFVCYSPRFSSLWWAKAPGVKFCQIRRGSTFVSICHSFLTTTLRSRTAPSVTYSTTEILTLEIPFILHKNFSEVLLSYPLVYPPIHNYVTLSEFSRHFVILALIISNQMVTSILRWSNTDNCAPSPRGNDSCIPFSSITTGCWSRSSSPERYICCNKL